MGLAGWTGLVVLAALGLVGIDLIQLLLLAGPLVVVPIGLPLVVASGPGLRWATTGAAFVLVLAFVVPASTSAATLSCAWLACTLAWTVLAVSRMLSSEQLTGLVALRTMAVAWLPVAAVHITTSRAGMTFAGIPPPLIELGGVHFDFAGFGATALATCLVAGSTGRRRSVAMSAAAALVMGTALVGIGHLTVRPLELAGTVGVTVAVMTIAVLGWRAAPSGTPRRTLLRISGLAVVAPMGFALAYSWALTTSSLHLSYETIAAVHGSLNAIGFVGCGLVAWRLHERRPASRGTAAPDEPVMASTP